MDILGGILMFIGFIIGMVFSIIILIKAFKTHILWGLGYLFVPFVAIVYIVKYWDDCKEPFLKLLICIPFYIIGGILVGMSAGAAG